MIPYKLDYAIEMVTSTEASLQGLLEAYTGKLIPKSEARKVWERIPDHKWYLSERLGRDVGMRVAAVDFVENFYEPPIRRSSDKWSQMLGKLSSNIGSQLKTYFEAKNRLMPL